MYGSVCDIVENRDLVWRGSPLIGWLIFDHMVGWRGAGGNGATALTVIRYFPSLVSPVGGTKKARGGSSIFRRADLLWVRSHTYSK